MFVHYKWDIMGVVDNMIYGTKTYIAGDCDGDAYLIQELKKWNIDKHLALSFVDVHEVTSSSDDSKPCSIKKSLRKRLNVSKTFILIVGTKTKDLRKGACYYNCLSYNWGSCSVSQTVDNRSFVEYECEMAVKDYNAGELKKYCGDI